MALQSGRRATTTARDAPRKYFVDPAAVEIDNFEAPTHAIECVAHLREVAKLGENKSRGCLIRPVLCDRQAQNADAADEHHKNRDDDCDNGPPNEKLGHFLALVLLVRF